MDGTAETVDSGDEGAESLDSGDATSTNSGGDGDSASTPTGDGDSGSSSMGDGDASTGDGDGDPNYFFDPRDDEGYSIVPIGDQRWMGENLRYNAIGSSRCYATINDNCDAYGRLYSSEASTTACPYGWHLPSDGEWMILESTLNMPDDELSLLSPTISRGASGGVGTAMKSGGSSGLDILMAGWHDTSEYVDDGLGYDTYLWSCTGDGQGGIIRRRLVSTDDGVLRLTNDPDRYWISIRCLED